MRIAIVLPKEFTFNIHKPNSIETVIRTINAPLLADNEILVFASQMAKQEDVFKTAKLNNSMGVTYTKSITDALKGFEPDIIEVHQNAKLAASIARKTNIPVCLYRHNYVKLKNGFLKFFQKTIYSKLNAIFFVSEASKDDFRKKFPEFSNRTYAIGNPIDVNKWAIPIDQKENIIFFAGRAAPEKGLEELCDALVKILAEFHDWRATLMLNDFQTHEKWATAQLDKLIEHREQLEILKNQPLGVVISEQSKAKIAVTPSKFMEPFGLVALEAHALCCALVSSGTGGLREASGENAIYLDKVDSESIYNSLKQLIQNPKVISKLAHDGRKWVEDEYNPRKRATQLMNYRNAIIG